MALQFLSAVEIPQLSHLERKRQIKDGPDCCTPNNVFYRDRGEVSVSTEVLVRLLERQPGG